MGSSKRGVSSNNVVVGGGGKLMRRLLGLGYWVQGFRCFPWLAVSFFLKDGLNVDPSTLQILQNSANLPMVGKPIYGLLSDSVYISGQHRIPYIALGGFLEVLFFFKILPFTVLIAQLCPPGCEGTIMAFLMSSIALAFIVSGYLGVALASYIKITASDFSGLPLALLIQAACTVLPIFWSSCIPDYVKTKAKKKD